MTLPLLDDAQLFSRVFLKITNHYQVVAVVVQLLENILQVVTTLIP